MPTNVSENLPLFFTSPNTQIDYYFFPDLVALNSETMVTNVAKMADVTKIRNRDAWGWTATLHVEDGKNKDDLDIKVYYSIPVEEETSVPGTSLKVLVRKF